MDLETYICDHGPAACRILQIAAVPARQASKMAELYMAARTHVVLERTVEDPETSSYLALAARLNYCYLP